MHYLEGLLSQHKDQIIILLCSIEAPFLIKKINKVLSHMEKTMQDLSLSIGGIQYRIRKIEDIIQKDLKVFSSASYLLMLIESLILVGEIKIDIGPMTQ